MRYDKIDIPKNLNQLMLGSMLGDGSITKPNGKSGACYYQEIHCTKQKDYCEWKFENLEGFKRTIDESSKLAKFPNGTSGIFGRVVIKSIAHPIFTQLREEWYPEGKKIVPKSVDQIEPLGLAVWYMDDGSYSSKTFKFYTNAFSKKDCEFLANLLLEKFQINVGIQTYMRSGKENNVLIVRAISRNRFLELIKPHLLESFKYKLGPYKTL